MRTSQSVYDMSRSEMKQNLMEQNMMAKLEVVKKEENDFVVKVPGRQELVRIEDTFAEMFRSVVTSPTTPFLQSFNERGFPVQTF